MTTTVLDHMEYGSDAAAQAAYVTNGIESGDLYTKILLHFNGENNSTVFENSASNTGITLTGAGDVKLDTSKYKFGVSSCKFDGSGDYLTIPYNSQLDFGTGDFSISMWFWWNSTGYQFLLGTGTTGGMMLALNYNNNANQIGLGRHNVLWDTIFYADAIPTSQWNYITVERKSGTAYCFLNNKLIGAAVNTATYTCMGAPLYIGQHAGGYYFNGWLDEVRISKGTSYIDLNNFTTEAAEYSTDADTIMLLHMDGADGSTVFEDSASVNKSIVVCGNSKLSTAQYKFGNSSILLDGSGDNLLFGSFSDFEFGSGDFTVECWFKFNSLPTGNAYNTGQYLLSNGPSFADEGFDLILGSTDVVFNLNYYSSTTIRGKYIPDTNWHHIALVRNGNLFYAFIDGYLVGSGYSTESMHSWTNPWCIGRCEATGENTGYFNGYIDEYRISTGISRFVPGSITVPSEQYSDDTYTKLLLHMDGADESTTFTDSSSSNRTVTKYGTSQIDTAYSVFNGTSGKFNGASDYLTVPYTTDFAFGTGDFTIDCWIRMNSMPTSDNWPSSWSSHMSIAGVGTPGWGDGCNLILGQTYLILQSNDSILVRGPHGISVGSWHHVAVCRSGNYFFLFVDGNLIGGAQSSVAMGTGSAVYIGCETGQGAWFNGWIDELRISKGVARWTSSFSAPNAFYTPDSHTKLLLHGEGENNSTSIVDSSESGNYVKNIGSTQIDTAQYKFNNASTYFDGGASGLYALHTQEFDFASNDFTIDFWIRANAVGQGNNTNLFSIFDNQTQVSQLVLGLGAGTYNITIWMSTTGSSWNVINGATLATLTQNVWAHIMVCRNNGTLYCYKDGVLSGARYIGDVSLYVPPANRAVWVGSGNYSGCYFNGWLDEFRVSSIARKPISLTAPVSEYEMPISTYLKAYSEPTIKTEGNYSLKGVATQTTSLSKSLIKTFSTPLNLSGHSYIVGKIRANRTGQNIGLSFGNHVYESNGRTYVTLTKSMSFTATATADVHVEVLGAGGAGGTPGGWTFGSPGGAGGKAEGDFTVQSGTTYHIVVGGKGVINSTTSAEGGGGIASINGSDNRYGGGGGGYSGIFTTAITQANALIIAGGGAGGGSSRAGIGNTGGSGGGAIGDDGISAYDSKTGYRGRGGSQIAAGADATSDSANLVGNQAALYGGNPRTNCYGGAGGGGYWGGSAGGYSESNTMGGGGGGSGYLHPTLIANGILTTGAGSAGGTSSTNGTGGIVVLSYDTGALSDIVIPYVAPNIITADTWQLIQYDISSIADVNKSSISNIFITVVNADADNTFYLDNLFAVTESDYNLSIAKANTYAVLTEPEVLSVIKANAYAVLTEAEVLSVTKANAYAVLQNSTDQYKESNISKVVAYSVLAPLSGSNISKAVVYSVIAPLSGSNISKVVAYSVLAPSQSSKPLTFIF